MNIFQAVVLGVVEGLTEYLPVSSTGHLLLAQELLGIPNETIPDREAAEAFAICIQAGAILAVLGIYFERVKGMAMGVLGRNPAGLKTFINVLIAFLPAVVIGLLFDKKIKAYLFNLETVTYAWLVGGIAILAVVWFKRSGSVGERNKGLSLEELTPKLALIIGLLQCIAMCPGVSRSLITMVGGMLVGLSLPAAVEFSFILGLLTLTAATAKDGREFHSLLLEKFGLVPIIVGLITAWASAWIAVKWMVNFLKTRSFAVFGYYRIALAIIVGALLMTGVIKSTRPPQPEAVAQTSN